jgi:hypothetical protein
MIDFFISSNSGRVTVRGTQIDSVNVDGRRIGYFNVAIESCHYGNDDYFDVDMETANFELTGVLLDLDTLQHAESLFRQKSLRDIRGRFDFGIGVGPKLTLAFKRFDLEPSNAEKAMVDLELGGEGAASFVVSFVVDPSCLERFVQRFSEEA